MANSGKLVITGEDRYLVKIQKMLRGYKKVNVEATGITNHVAEAKKQRAKDEQTIKEQQDQTPAKGAQDMTTANVNGLRVTESVPKGKTKK
jgi:hypothetical protein